MTDSDTTPEGGDGSDTQTDRRHRIRGYRPDRRRMLKTLGAVGTAGLALTAGCSGSNGGDGGGSSNGDSGSVEVPDSITIVQENVPDTAALEPLLDDFEEETGISAEMTKDPYEVLQEKVSTQLQSNSPDFDVAIYDQYWLGDFVEGGLARSLEDRVADSDVIDPDTYFDPVWESTAVYDDSIWSVPFFQYTNAMMYRTDILQDEELKAEYDGNFAVPETIEEYVSLCKYLTANTDDDFYGAAMQGKRGAPIHDEYMNYFHGMGGKFVTPDGEVMVDKNGNRDIAVEALEVYIDNMNNGAPEASKSMKFSESLEILGNGDAFSMLTYNVLFPILANNTEAGDMLGFDLVPGKSPPIWGWSWGIPANVDEGRAEAAWRFIEWAESFETRKERMLNGGSPTAPDVLQEDEVVEQNPEFYGKQEELITNATPWTNVPGTTQAVQNWGTQLSLAVAGDKSPEKAIDDGISQVKSAFQ
jgi:multiple sugar transport system substrate-binding protein